MPTTIDVLTRGGILRAADVVSIASTARLDLACAAVLLVKESGRLVNGVWTYGNNIWGRDGVPTGGAYTKGGDVTQTNYAAYRAALKAGTAGRQGCGPTQLTYGPFQDQADSRGGCWRWEVNAAVGFEQLAALIRQYGEQDGFRRYNGSGSAAEAYGRDAVTKLVDWRKRLAGATNGPVTPTGLPTLTYGMTGNASVGHLQTFLRVNYPAYAKSLPTTGNYLDQTAAAVLEYQTRSRITNADGSKPNGRTVGDRTNAQLWKDGYRG
jgi:hypothetical protein